MEYEIKTPLSESDAKMLRAGDIVYLTGTLFSARDAAHKRMTEA
ncbi:MAG: fumarate hydratase C-terminal domain-containing protein, partial [Oscillospiraceae bacterium]|nr:fumarate hydratase C-terminal domain-containing protein [Oscillospiraceae bacterium]